jgi:hypothetical protein
MVLCLIFSTIGLFGYGNLLQNYASVYVQATFHGITLLGILIGAIATLGYASDAVRDSMSMVFKNLLFSGMSYFVNDWVEEKTCSSVLGGITILPVCLCKTWLIFVFSMRLVLRLWNAGTQLLGSSSISLLLLS